MEEFEADKAFNRKQEVVYRDPAVSMPPIPPIPSQETQTAPRNYIGAAVKLELLLEVKEKLIERIDDKERKAQFKQDIEKLKKTLKHIKDK